MNKYSYFSADDKGRCYRSSFSKTVEVSYCNIDVVVTENKKSTSNRFFKHLKQRLGSLNFNK